MDEINLENLTEEQKLYLKNLQKQVNGASMLSREVSMLKAAVAHDMELIRTGQQGENYEHLKYVCFDKLSPRFNVVQVLMKTINTIEEPVSKGGRPTKSVAGKETIAIAGELEEPAPIPQAKTNFFETISMEVVNGGKRR